MVDSNNILSYLRNNKNRLIHDYHLTKIGLFGSMARGEQNDSSDIDLAIEFKPNTPDLYSLKLRLKEEIQSRFDRQVDICRIKYIKPIFKKQIQSEIRYV
ncbi:MAG: hypothetical protein GVY19_00130 [Bacteroidetes bacterium]|jgi:predicted nucleotidyltransferase|nr:hypothetical protein [Bacteroidota bacterium]